MSIRKCFSFVLAVAAACLPGCAGPIPAESYVPSSDVQDVALGEFIYAPAAGMRLKPNQIRTTALGAIYLNVNVADMVKRATALEMEKAEIVLDDPSFVVAGDILEFTVEDSGRDVQWTYAIRYKIIDRRTGEETYSRECRPEVKKIERAALPAELSSVMHEMVLNGYDMFIRDPAAQNLLDRSKAVIEKK